MDRRLVAAVLAVVLAVGAIGIPRVLDTIVGDPAICASLDPVSDPILWWIFECHAKDSAGGGGGGAG